MKNKNRVIILTSIIVGVLVVTLGLTYAVLSFNETKGNSELVLGDIWMHYTETTNSINIDNMLPMNTLTLNTSEEAVNKCVNYLYTTYGDNWNDLEYDGGIQEESNRNQNSLANFMATLLDTYERYCAGETMEIYPTVVPTSTNRNDYVVRPIPQSAEPLREVNILTDYENGVLTEVDKKYFHENNILVDNVKNLDYFEFTIDGKNTHTKRNVIYNIQLVEGDVPTIENISETLNRINSKYLRFRLTEVNGEEEIILKDNMQYDSLTNVTIHSDAILKNTTSEINRTYRLYMWIDGDVIIGNTSDANYSMEEWNNLYASVKVNVNGKYAEGEILTEKIKNKLGTEGLVAVNTNGDLYDGTGEIREYRYSGLGNYCTYTDGENDYNLNVEGETCPVNACLLDGIYVVNGNSEAFALMGSCADMNGTELPLKVEGSTPTDLGLRNYVEFNGELWRIVGVFGDNVKIIKDTPISNDAYSGTTYTTYNLKFTTEGTKYGYYIFKQLSDNSYDNDWTTSGVMHYLNDETGNSYYANNLSLDAKNMIVEGTFYTGGVGNNMESAAAIYDDEQSANWTGKIGLLQTSDFLYSTDTPIWNKEYLSDIAGLRTSWLGNTEAYAFWLLSPFASDSSSVFNWDCRGRVGTGSAYFIAALRPVLNLKSTVMTTSGDGSYNSPYKLIVG